MCDWQKLFEWMEYSVQWQSTEDTQQMLIYLDYRRRRHQYQNKIYINCFIFLLRIGPPTCAISTSYCSLLTHNAIHIESNRAVKCSIASYELFSFVQTRFATGTLNTIRIWKQDGEMKKSKKKRNRYRCTETPEKNIQRHNHIKYIKTQWKPIRT